MSDEIKETIKKLLEIIENNPGSMLESCEYILKVMPFDEFFDFWVRPKLEIMAAEYRKKTIKITADNDTY